MKCAGLLPFLLINLTVSAFAAVTVTSPKPGSTVTSPVQYLASAAASGCSKGIAAMGIYVNNKLIYTIKKTSINTSISLAPGAQHTVVEAWDKCGKGYHTTINLTVITSANPTVAISANPPSIVPGLSSTIIVNATHATSVVITGDPTPYTLNSTGGSQIVTPSTTTVYTATATGTGGSTVTATATVTVGPRALTSISVSPNPSSFALGTTLQFTATANYNDGSSADITSTAAWSIANPAVATVDSSGLATPVASGSTKVTASLSGVAGNTRLSVTIAPGTAINIPTWHADTLRSGLNNNEQSLTTNNVSSATFGKLFSLPINGYAYAQPLLISGVNINGAVHNVLYVATETNDVYALDADTYGPPLWHVTTMKTGETPDNVTTSSAIYPTIGITSTPVIDVSTNTMYVVSKQRSASTGTFFRLSALDITTGLQKFGGPIQIGASITTTNSLAANLSTSCIQRSALLLDHQNVYFGFGSCHTGWMLAYDKTSLLQSGVFNASPVLNGEGKYASAGGVWMGGGGPASYADSSTGGDGSVFITTGNGPWDGQSAWSDSVLKFAQPPAPTLTSGPVLMQPADYFTPQDWHYMFCDDADMASGGLLLIPDSTMALAGAKTAWMYLVNTANLGGEQAGDTGAYQTLQFESDKIAPITKTCTDGPTTAPTNWTIQGSNYEIYSTAAYFNGSVYQGITAEARNIPAGLRQFILNNANSSTPTLTPSTYTAFGTELEIRGTTPFISANNNADGVVWMIDQNEPLGASGFAPGIATLRAFDPNNLADGYLRDSGDPNILWF